MYLLIPHEKSEQRNSSPSLFISPSSTFTQGRCGFGPSEVISQEAEKVGDVGKECVSVAGRGGWYFKSAVIGSWYLQPRPCLSVKLLTLLLGEVNSGTVRALLSSLASVGKPSPTARGWPLPSASHLTNGPIPG